jgi:hypothetical protein
MVCLNKHYNIVCIPVGIGPEVGLGGGESATVGLLTMLEGRMYMGLQNIIYYFAREH